MTSPAISIIVPCFKQAEYLPEALDSLIAQTFENWEAVVVNDGSPDHTEEIALAYAAKDPRIKYLPLENGGVARARNRGIAIAQVSTIGFFGFLACPPMVGFLSHLLNLRWALSPIILVGAAIFVLAGLAGRMKQ